MQNETPFKSKEAAEYLGISKSKCDKLRTYGGGPRYYKIDHRVVYDVCDLDAWVSERLAPIPRRITRRRGRHARNRKKPRV